MNQSLPARVLSAFVLTALAVVMLAGAAPKSGPILEPNKLIILSTVDVKGKTSPCG